MQPSDYNALLVDDHPIVIDALTLALRTFCVFNRIDYEQSLALAIKRLHADIDYNLIILDLHLTDTRGEESLIGLREKFPDIPVVVFSGERNADIILKAFDLGVRGYITKDIPIQDILSAIKTVLAGKSYIPPSAIKIMKSNSPIAKIDNNPVQQLTPRQTQVLHYLLQGMPNKVIARRLDMAEGTVKAHLNTVYRVFNASNRSQVIVKANALGLFQEGNE